LSLTDEERNLLLGGGILVVGGLTAAAVLSAVQGAEIIPAENSLSIEATSGGTTDPAPKTYTYSTPSSVVVSAITFEGYVFKGWYLNGSFVGIDATLTVMVQKQNLLIASFEKINAPILIPAYIAPIQNCVAESYWATEAIDTFSSITGLWNGQQLHLFQEWLVTGFVKFKIQDQAGNGVPDQMIALFTDVMPDITDFGQLRLGAGYEQTNVHTASNPLFVTSDSDGVVACKVEYMWLEVSNFRDTIGKAGKVHASGWWPWGEADFSPIYDGLLGGPFRGFTTFTRLMNPIYWTKNPVHAYWVDNPNLRVLGDAYVDCLVKLEPSKNY